MEWPKNVEINQVLQRTLTPKVTEHQGYHTECCAAYPGQRSQRSRLPAVLYPKPYQQCTQQQYSFGLQDQGSRSNQHARCKQQPGPADVPPEDHADHSEQGSAIAVYVVADLRPQCAKICAENKKARQHLIAAAYPARQEIDRKRRSQCAYEEADPACQKCYSEEL